MMWEFKKLSSLQKAEQLFFILFWRYSLVAVLFVWSVLELDNVVEELETVSEAQNQLVQSSELVIRKRYFGGGDYVLKEIF